MPELSGNPKPAKQPRLDLDTVGFITEMGELVTRDQVAVLAACEELPCAVEIRKVTYAHEDEHVELAFGKDDVDGLEEYDMVELQDAKDEFLESDGGLDPRLCKPTGTQTWSLNATTWSCRGWTRWLTQWSWEGWFRWEFSSRRSVRVM